MTNPITRNPTSSTAAVALVMGLTPGLAWAQGPVPPAAPDPMPAEDTPAGNAGGHLGIAVPLVTVTDAETTTVADAFTLAHPIGVGVKVSRKLTVDFEIVVNNPIDPVGPTNLVVDPGLVYNFGPVAAGLRVAWQIGQTANIGLIPLVNKGIVEFDGATWFIEAAFPTFYSDHDVAFNVVAHTGIGF